MTQLTLGQTQREGSAIEEEKKLGKIIHKVPATRYLVKNKVKDEDKGKSHPAKARALSLTMRRGYNDDISGYSFGQK